jgi:hypothetical protein
MRLQYSTRKGRFYIGSSEETYSCHIAVYDDDNKKLISTNITTEYEVDGNDPEEIMDEIQDAIKRYWTTGDDRKDCWQFILDHKEEIELGNDEYELSQVLKQIEQLSSRAESLSKNIAQYTKDKVGNAA